MNNEFTDKIWKDNPELIREFLELQPLHDRIREEIAYILRLRLNNANVEISQISSRAKTLSSFCEKLDRKKYKNPIKEITDLAGVRIVYLYISDLPIIEKIIESEFKILEKENKLDDKEDERFGYGALHYLVRIKKGHSGARYDDLRKLVCEIQVRTILQDAWSTVAYHLSYKKETDVPKPLLRKLNALSGLFETADDQFENLRKARFHYIKDFEKEVSSEKKLLNQSINIDNLSAYLSTKFPDRIHADSESLSALLDELNSYDYKSLLDLDIMLEETMKAAIKVEADYPPSSESGVFNDMGIVRTALAVFDDNYCVSKYGKAKKDKLSKYKPFIKMR